MDTTAATDQADAAIRDIREAEHFWPHNAHLINDDYLNEAVHESINGRERDVFDAVLHPDSVPRFVDGDNLSEGYHSIHAAYHGPVGSEMVRCDRCIHNGLKNWFRTDQANVVAILAPPSVVYFRVCAVCKIQLESDYSPIHWGLNSNGSV